MICLDSKLKRGLWLGNVHNKTQRVDKLSHIKHVCILTFPFNTQRWNLRFGILIPWRRQWPWITEFDVKCTKNNEAFITQNVNWWQHTTMIGDWRMIALMTKKWLLWSKDGYTNGLRNIYRKWHYGKACEQVDGCRLNPK